MALKKVKETEFSQLVQAGDKYGKEMTEHEQNGYHRGYKDASAYYQAVVSKLTQVAIQNYSKGYGHGHGDGYDEAHNRVATRLLGDKGRLNQDKINKILDQLLDEIQGQEVAPRLKA